MGSILSLLTTRVLGLALAASIAVGGLFSGYLGLRLKGTEKEAETARTALTQALVESAVLSKTLATQNAAVEGLKADLAAKQAAVSAAETQVAQLSKQAEARATALQAAKVPTECPGAVGWLEDQLGSAGQ